MADSVKREFNNLQEAFGALSEEEQEHARRVSEFLQVFFLQCCVNDVYLDDPKAGVRLTEENRDIIALGGLYHDIGKSLVPAAYQKNSEDLGPEEQALYRLHPSDSEKLINTYLGERKVYKSNEMNYLREIALNHHEYWNGTGYPGALKGENIPILGRMAAIADALDHYAMERRAEQPLDYALKRLSDEAGILFDPVLVKILKTAKAKLKRVFNAHLGESRAVPEVENFVNRTASRPMYLSYRPIVYRRNGSRAAYDCIFRFRDKDGIREYDEGMKKIIREEKLTMDMGVYFLLEAMDSVNRFNACGIRFDFLAVPLPIGFYNQRGVVKEFTEALRDTEVPAEKIAAVITPEDYQKRTKTMFENLRKLKEAGVRILYRNISPEKLKEESFEELSMTHCSIGSDMEERVEEEGVVSFYKDLQEKNVVLISDDLEKKKIGPAVGRLGVTLQMGPATGDYIEENELVETELMLQQ